MRLPTSLLGTIFLAGCSLHQGQRAANVPPMTAADVPGAPVVASEAAAPRAPVARPEPESAHGTVIPAGAPAGPAPANPAAVVTRNEVARRAIEVFGDSLILLPPPQLDSFAAEPTWDMDVRAYETQERVAHYVAMFTGKSKGRIAERLERGTRYEPMIRAKFKAGGLPEDMYYLALIESGFDNNAYSRAAAVGMWQFMTATARGLGMRVDWWVDERRDPIKSTATAVRFIKGMRDQFGSLYLATAAYNGGPGRVARALARYADDLEGTQGEDAFFVLAEKDYLHNETREYVPQLIAAALIAKEPERYGMRINAREPFAYDSVRVPGATPLSAIAKAGRTSVSALRDLNPQLLRGMTPPRETYLVRLPVGSAVHFDSAFAALSKEERVATRVVESKKGDTVDQLAERAGISSASLVAFNPNLRRLKPSGRLVPGQAILLPVPSVAAAALRIPDPSIEKYPRSDGRLKVHTVRSGESVGLIARKYGTTTDRLMRLNGMRKPTIFAGQSLIVSGTPRASGGSGKARSSTKGSRSVSKRSAKRTRSS